jgi:hypothetical protein
MIKYKILLMISNRGARDGAGSAFDIAHRKFHLFYLDTHFRPGPGLNSRPSEPNLLAAKDQRARLLDHLDKTKILISMAMEFSQRCPVLHGHWDRNFNVQLSWVFQTETHHSLHGWVIFVRIRILKTLLLKIGMPVVYRYSCQVCLSNAVAQSENSSSFTT